MKKVLLLSAVVLFATSCSIVKNDSLIKGSSIKSADDVFITTVKSSTTLEPGLDYTIYVLDNEGIVENLKLLGRDKVGVKKSETTGVWVISKTEEETEKVLSINELIPYRRPVRFQSGK